MARISRETRQKETIRQELSSFSSFFTAEDLYGKVRKESPGIGLATVYRFLNSLAKKDYLHSYLCNRKTVYSTNKSNHFHFICKRCGKTEHINIKNIDFIKKSIKGNICHLQIDTYGICESCSGGN